MQTALTDELLDRMIDHAARWMDEHDRAPEYRQDNRWAWSGGPLWRLEPNGLPPELWLHICTADCDTQAILTYPNKAEAVNDLAVALLALKVYGLPEGMTAQHEHTAHEFETAPVQAA